MKLLANENFPLDSVKYLVNEGFDVLSIGFTAAGLRDAEVMNIAISEKRTILTFDRDYGELIFKHHYQPEMGVIFLRLSNFQSDEPGRIIQQLFAKPDFDPKKKLTVVAEDTVRQRSY